MSTARRRVQLLVAAMLLIAGLLAANAARAQEPDAESLREAEAALLAESSPQSANPVGYAPPMSGVEPLFGGVDDVNLPTNGYSTTPPGPTWTPLFGGLQVWGSAYNYDNGLLYIVNGTQLWSFDPAAGGAPTLVTAITSTDGVPLSVVSLAYYEGTFYSNRNVSTTAGPEGLYTINATTGVATLIAAFATTFDLGGLDVDRTTGILYGTNDGTPSRGLVTVDKTTAAITLVAAYPAGETDIDGLAVGGGKAYLVEDDSLAAGGLVHVYNLTTNAYEPGIPVPWTTSETFSGGAWMEDAAGGEIVLDKTVGTSDSTCATTDSIIVPPGTQVTYCYEVTNNTDVTLTRHDLVDSELGTILNDFPFTLVPGASAFLTASTVINVTTVNTGTWTAFNPPPKSNEGGGESFTDSDTAEVIVEGATPTPTATPVPPGGTCSTNPDLEVFYFSDFETDDGGWVESGFGDWERGAPVLGVYEGCDASPRPEPSGAHSGANVWATNLNGCYTNSNADNIISQTFDFSGRTAPIFLNWWHWYEVFETFDYAIVRVNGVQVWRTPNATATPNYIQQSIDLSAYAGQANVTVEFLLHATTVVNRTGWYVDDVELCSAGSGGPTPTPTATTVPPTMTATTVPPTMTATTVPPTMTATTVPPVTPTATLPPTSIELGSIGEQGSGGAGWLLSLAGLALVAVGVILRRRR